MRSKIILSFIIGLYLPLLAFTQNREVSIRIVQDQSFLLDQYDNNVTLEKKAFKIQVLLENVAGIYAFAAFSDSLCCRLTELDSISDFMNLPQRTMPESDYNKEKELLVNDDNSCGYWYHDKEIVSKGFNKKLYVLGENRVVAIKSIKQLYYVPEKKEVKLKDVRQPLYLFFVAVKEFDNAGRPMTELLRRKVRIDWVDAK